MDAGSQTLKFWLAEETGELHARFEPAEGVAPPDIATLKQQLVDSGFGDLYLNEQALADFSRRCETTKLSLDLVIGERRDGKFSLTVSDDLMSAYLTLTPAQGGKPVGSEVIDALREEGIVYGIRHSQLDAALAAGQCDHLLVAQGDMAQEAGATRFENLFQGKEKQGGAEDERAVIRLSDISHLLLVLPGDALMRRIPPQPGKNGTNIKNELVFPKAVQEVFFSTDLLGAAPDENDPDLLVATHAGQPVSVGNGVKVNPVIEVADVDVNTGSITFEGTVQVKGDIKAGMQVNVTGDVIANGLIESAQIYAGGNVSVRGGIIGHADTHSGASHGLPENTARIRCAGTVQALFMEYAHVEAGDSILIEHGASQCELIAGNEILVGKEGAKAGQIIGGVVQATHLIRCALLGSTTGSKTSVNVGFDPYLDGEIHARKRLLQHKVDELERVILLINYIKQNPKKDTGGLGEKTENTRRLLLDEIEALNAELAQLGEKAESVEHARVEVGKTMHAGVEIRIGRHVKLINDDMAGGTIRVHEEEIVLAD